MRKKTHEEYVAEVAAVNPDIEIIGTYVNNSTNIIHRCKIDGYEWNVRPVNILNGKGCPICGGNKRKTHEEYVEQVAFLNPNIEIIEVYNGAHTKILHKCKIDGYEWAARPANILSGKGCPRCAKNERYGHDGYVNRILEINPNIEVIGHYIDNNTPILHRCKIDGYEWTAIPNHILKGQGCHRCNGVERYTQKEYVKRVFETNQNIEVLGVYINAKTKILHRCKIDGYEWLVAPDSILQGHGCPKCSAISKGEKIISNWLDDKCIFYIPQKTFDGCKDIIALRFDFYLPDYNILIEYNGIQHYEPVAYFGGEEGFQNTVKRDKIKENYCKENNITLIKIPYYADIYEELGKLYELIYE